MNMKSEKGITMISLALTLVLIGIFATIGVNYGLDLITKAESESVKTNMLLIKSKVKEYQEEVDFRSGIEDDEEMAETARSEIYEESVGLEEIIELTESLKEIGIPEDNKNYYLTDDTFEIMGLNQITLRADEKYIISFDEEEDTAEIYTTLGVVTEKIVDGEKNYETKYSLTDIGE